jgi:hypothetical protein
MRVAGIEDKMDIFMRHWGLKFVVLGTIVIFTSACRKSDEQIKVYRVAKAPLESSSAEQNTMPTNLGSPSSLSEKAPPAATAASVPSNWEPQPPSQMRQASFLVHGENGAIADVSLVSLGAAAGNVLDNVNRWRSQLAQAPITADQLTNAVQKLQTARGDAAIVDLTGQPENGDSNKDGHIIAAIASDGDRTEFFKMRGNAALVGAEKANFLKWVSSVRGTNATATATDAQASAEPDKPEIKWEVPTGWSPAPATAMRYASFTATGSTGEKIDISVVSFPGDGGSDADNINRWRQQIGLSPKEREADIVPLETAGTTFSTVDIAGPKARTLAAWTRREGRTWFLKLTGPNAAVEKEKPNFVKFVKSVRF